MILGLGFGKYLLEGLKCIGRLNDDDCRASLERLCVVVLYCKRIDISVIGVYVERRVKLFSFFSWTGHDKGSAFAVAQGVWDFGQMVSLDQDIT